ncbi:porin family protein [Agriterribacter sp.]|uniref:porin family protein n=1 Tax=Agriterribacter sp. TaxID=2821509 RepID=UPI002C5B783F|nr:porin family protein [Agriterribacter sp.]HRO47184.1 porin family protein [Agriterribacter sp.]HRQ18711.1 porin family protein [Agriterribacter sp.]
MKNYIALCIICCCVFLPGSLFSQTISAGINGGISIPQLKSSGDNEISKDYSSRLAATFGLFADIGITQQFSVKAAVNYAGQGGKRQGMQPVTAIPPALSQMLPPGTILYADFKNESVLNYLEIPVTAKFRWGSTLKYYLNAGPYIGILLNASQKTNGNSRLYFDKGATQPLSMQGQPLPSQSFKADTDIKKDINPVNLGITGGIGLAYPVGGSGEIILDARGAYGLTTIQKDTKANGKSRTGGLFITLGYAYTFHH